MMKAKMTHAICIMVLIFSLLLAGCDQLNLPVGAAGAGGTTAVVITHPQDGASVQPGEMVVVHANILDAGGATAVMLEVNGVLERNERFNTPMTSGSVDIPWIAAEIKTYILKVLIESSSGAIVESNSITLNAGGEPLVTMPSTTDETATPIDSPTPTVTLIPTITFTPTLGAPMAEALQNINCRYGPDEVYTIVSGFHTNQTAPIVGRNQNSSWWLIQDAYSASKCWVLAELVSVTGDVSQVPFVAAPPTPTLTFTSTPTFTPSPTVTQIPVSAPVPISPQGKLKCMGRIVLKWNPVDHPSGIAYYEWVLEGASSGSQSNTTIETQVVVPTNCGEEYYWRVRAVAGDGTAGPYSSDMVFILQ